jgi:acetamidase/formamidase
MFESGWGKQNPHDIGHALVGPVEIRGAEPGMTLEITINEILPGSWGGIVQVGFHFQLSECTMGRVSQQ